MKQIKDRINAALDRLMVAAFIAIAFWPEVVVVAIASAFATFIAVGR